MLEYDVVAQRSDAHGSAARCKDAEIILDTDVQGRLRCIQSRRITSCGGCRLHDQGHRARSANDSRASRRLQHGLVHDAPDPLGDDAGTSTRQARRPRTDRGGGRDAPQKSSRSRRS